MLSNLNITFKDILNIPARWNTDHVLLTRRAYAVEQVPEHIGWPLVFIDECPFNMKVWPCQGQALSGHPAHLTTLPKGHNLTLISTLSNTGIVYSKFVPSNDKKPGVTADDFRQFLLDLHHHLPPNTLIILDNASIHHTDTIHNTLDLLHSTGFDYLFGRAASPFVNAIKYAFSKLKNRVCQVTFNNCGELQHMISVAVHSITAAYATHWICHMASYFPQCSLALPFRGKLLCPTMEPNPLPISTKLTHEWALFIGALPLPQLTY